MLTRLNPQAMELLSSDTYTVNTGFFQFHHPAITTSTKVVVTPRYLNGAVGSYVFTSQPLAGYVNVYVRYGANQVPPDGTKVGVFIFAA